ncbi:MAG: thioesterase family protein [Asgard group archaeon]|nr:thioesterase family protein [Asgard group archaeon]
MNFTLPKNLTKTKEFEVKEQHIADFLGSGKVSVLSTPSMILFMEQTAMLAAKDQLPEGWITVGTRVDIKHLKASKLGATISVKASLKKQEDKHLVFTVEAYCEKELIGSGIHERHIVNKEKFLARLKE